jgi:hypothetical protein
MNKKYKIGEYCQGGIIHVTKNKSFISIQALDYNTQSPASHKVNFVNCLQSKGSIDNFLNDLTSCYYAEKILSEIFKN